MRPTNKPHGFDQPRSLGEPRAWVLGLFLGVLALAYPLVMGAVDQPYFITFASRVFVFALAATSLNLILGYGGMVSFGHAAFVGTGAYATAILAQAGWVSAWANWPIALGVCALLASVIGVLSLRTRGLYFIMITLAFAQMLYYLAVSLRVYGGEDGMPVRRTLLPFGLELRDEIVLYYTSLLVLALALLLTWRLVNARFGWILRASSENPTRAASLGLPVFYYQLVAFVLAGTMGGMAGILLANLNGWVSPSFLSWHLSGQLMMMVILGGVARLWGGVLGAVAYLFLETLLSEFTIHWQLFLGGLLLLAVLAVKKGLTGLWGKERG